MNVNVTITLTPTLEELPKLKGFLTELLSGSTAAVEMKPSAQQQSPVANSPMPPVASSQTVMPLQQAPITGVPVQPQPVAPSQPGAPIQSVPTAAAPTYTLDQLSRAAAMLMDAGKREQLVALLNKFGVQALTMLPKESYGVFATELRQLGAQI